jgi:hypothetical protein
MYKALNVKLEVLKCLVDFRLKRSYGMGLSVTPILLCVENHNMSK